MSRPAGKAGQITRARATLERLQDDTAAADPYALAPVQYIADHLDGLHGINLRDLHTRVAKVLRDVEGLVAANPDLGPAKT